MKPVLFTNQISIKGLDNLSSAIDYERNLSTAKANGRIIRPFSLKIQNILDHDISVYM